MFSVRFHEHRQILWFPWGFLQGLAESDPEAQTRTTLLGRVCGTENSIRVDNATESPNLSGDDRPVLPLLVPVRLAVQVEGST
jgi:hypothetical protein